MISDVDGEDIPIDRPMTPQQIRDLFYVRLSRTSPAKICLQQEIVLYLGKLCATSPTLFLGILNIKIDWILRAMVHLVSIHVAADRPVAVVALDDMSPSRIRKLVYQLLTFNEENMDIEYR